MNSDLRSRINEIKKTMDCSKNFVCEESDFKDICRVEDIGAESFLYCKELIASNCTFRKQFADRYVCKCPIRLLVAKEIEAFD